MEDMLCVPKSECSSRSIELDVAKQSTDFDTLSQLPRRPHFHASTQSRAPIFSPLLPCTPRSKNRIRSFQTERLVLSSSLLLGKSPDSSAWSSDHLQRTRKRAAIKAIIAAHFPSIPLASCLPSALRRPSNARSLLRRLRDRGNVPTWLVRTWTDSSLTLEDSGGCGGNSSRWIVMRLLGRPVLYWLAGKLNGAHSRGEESTAFYSI